MHDDIFNNITSELIVSVILDWIDDNNKRATSLEWPLLGRMRNVAVNLIFKKGMHSLFTSP